MSACSCGAPINPRWRACVVCGAAVLALPSAAPFPVADTVESRSLPTQPAVGRGGAPEYRRQLLFWPRDLWQRWKADTISLVSEGVDTPSAGHLAFERLKAAAPRTRLTLPPTVPAPGCRCPMCDQGAHKPSERGHTA